MEYKIINNPDYTNIFKVGLVFTPDNKPFKFLFTQIKLKDYPEFIAEVSQSISTGYEFIHVHFYNDMDWETKEWAKSVKGTDIGQGEVFIIHDLIGETIVKEELFDRVLYDYAFELLCVYREDKRLSTDWSSKMESALRLLKFSHSK